MIHIFQLILEVLTILFEYMVNMLFINLKEYAVLSKKTISKFKQQCQVFIIQKINVYFL